MKLKRSTLRRGIFFLVILLCCACKEISRTSTSSVPPADNSETRGTESPHGNADGYAGLSGRTAYQVDPLATCPTGNAVVYPGYRSSLEFTDDKSVRLQDPCSLTKTPIDPQRLDVLNDRIVGYRGDIFEVQTSPPTTELGAAYFSAWCRSAESPKGLGPGLLLQERTGVEGGEALLYERDRIALKIHEPLSVELVRNNSEIRFDSDDVHATIRVGWGMFHPGTLTLSGTTHSLVCRVLVAR